MGLTICEDVWFPGPPASVEALAGARLIVNASASPYHRGKGAFREGLLAERAPETGAVFALCNLVGGQDELVFDGHSLVVSADGRGAGSRRPVRGGPGPLRPRAARGPPRRPAPRTCAGAPGRPLAASFEATGAPGGATDAPPPSRSTEDAEVYAALVLGLRDYVTKNGFERVLVAVSGGIDSALVALVAADAIGGERLTCVVMPSPHSSAETQADARAIAANLGAELVDIPIEPAMARLRRRCSTRPGGRIDLAAENIQARIRGNLIMAISNRTAGWC